MRFFRPALLAAALVFPGTAGAQEIPPAFLAEMREIVTARISLIVLEHQNSWSHKLSAEEIEELDAQWRAETESDNQPLIAELMGNPLSSFLIRKKAESNGLYTEIFVFDARGMNVGQSSVTSDYWQGDEGKYQNTVAVGPDAVFVDDIEFHNESRQRRRQVSFTIVDPATGQPVGGATVEVNVDELERRS